MTFRYALAAFSVAAFLASGVQAEPRIVVLSEQDEAAYREAFSAIDAGNWRGVGTALGTRAVRRGAGAPAGPTRHDRPRSSDRAGRRHPA